MQTHTGTRHTSERQFVASVRLEGCTTGCLKRMHSAVGDSACNDCPAGANGSGRGTRLQQLLGNKSFQGAGSNCTLVGCLRQGVLSLQRFADLALCGRGQLYRAVSMCSFAAQCISLRNALVRHHLCAVGASVSQVLCACLQQNQSQSLEAAAAAGGGGALPAVLHGFGQSGGAGGGGMEYFEALNAHSRVS